MSATEPLAVEVIDVLGGLATLDKRSPTLDGSVPLRVAQGCLPFLQGNEVGWQLTLRRALVARRALGRWSVSSEGDPALDPEVALRAALPVMVVRGLIAEGAEAFRALARGAIQCAGGFGRDARIRVFTGLLVRPTGVVRLRVSSSANRRNSSFEVTERTLAPDAGWQPLWVELAPADGVTELLLSGEVASVIPLAATSPWRVRALAEAPEVGRAHVAFFDPAYFAAKRGTVTRKYRRMVAEETLDDVAGEPEFIVAGDARYALEGAQGGAVPTLSLHNPHAFRARFDGHTVRIDHDARALAARAVALRATWAAVYGDGFLTEHWRAMLYLTKFFTPHPPGEPHFFVKAEGFVRTPPGWSSLFEGVHGDGYDVMRGVVSTDVFFAAPAVFQLRAQHRWIDVPEGRALARVTPIPRRMLGAVIKPVAFGVG